MARQSDWSTKFCKLFLRVADREQANFRRKGKLPDKKTVQSSDLNQDKKARTRREKEANICRKYMSPIEIR